MIGVSYTEGLAMFERFPDHKGYFIEKAREVHQKKKASESILLADALTHTELYKHNTTRHAYNRWLNEKLGAVRGTLRKVEKREPTLFERRRADRKRRA